MARQAPAGSARRRWTVAWIVRVTLVVAVAGAVWVADRVFDSAWVAAAVGSLVLTTPWTVYLLVTHRRSSAGTGKMWKRSRPAPTPEEPGPDRESPPTR